jgi:hypothetical protein
MLKKIVIGLGCVIVALLVAAALQPADFRIARTETMAAPPAAVFALVNDFHKWEAWSPWAKLDPAMKTTYEGPASGPGAIYSWAGNEKVGEGRMTILDSQPNLVRIRLEFLKPFAATNTAEFAIQPQGPSTSVTWSMTGHNNLMAKMFSLFMSMDKMVGPDFDKGLAQMKALVESTAPAR